MQVINRETKDFELIVLTLERDKNYYKFIVLRYQNRLYSYLFKLLNFNQEDTKDCLSHTFIKAYYKLNSYQIDRSFSAWIYKIAHNIAVDYIRKHSGKHLSFDQVMDIAISSPYTSISPFSEKLDYILTKLTVDEKNLLILFYQENMSLQELSDIYNLLPNTLAARVKRAKDKAKKLIKQYYE
ncbi:MAG: sigma-70 family RNA polymerase sigma factor [candidate division SR1 bacterium]|nr:sigma-70 family RNA polymerase sigma factor [candidate division SR1 bacterium]